MSRVIFKKIDWYIVVLVCVAMLTHLRWFDYSSQLFSWDWPLLSDGVTRNFPLWGNGIYMSYLEFGVKEIQAYWNFFIILWGLIGQYSMALKITIMIPIALLSVLSPYFLIKFLLKNKKVAFVCSLLFSFSVSLMYLELSHLSIAFAFSMTPLIVLFFLKFLKDSSYGNLISFAFVYSVGLCYEVRIMYIVSFVLFTLWIIFFDKKLFKQNVIKYLYLVVLILLLNLFWTLPSLFGNSDVLGDMTSRGVTDEGSSDILYSFTDFKSKWSGGLVTQASVDHEIHWLAWLTPVLAFSIFYFFKKVRNIEDKKYILFFGTIALVGIFLSKQGDSPFEKLYDWLYNNFPGFGLFRVGSKFLVLVAFGYLGLFAYLIKYLIIENRRLKEYQKNIILIGFSILFLWNAKPLLTREVGNLFVNRVEPKEYRVLQEFIVSQEGFFRTMWFPKSSQWAYFDFSRPKVSASVIKEREFEYFGKYQHRDDDSLVYPFGEPYGDYLADVSNIKYFIVPMIDSQDEMLYGQDPSKERKKLIDELEKTSFLTKVDLDGLGDVEVYENKGIRPYIFPLESITDPSIGDVSLPKVSYEFVNPTKKKVLVANAKEPFYLIMSEKYDSGWKAILDDECSDAFWKKVSPFAKCDKIADKNHKNFVNFLSTWYVEPVNLCKKNDCEKNKDGSYNINIQMEYWPQRWYYSGLLISSATVAVGVMFLVYLKLKRDNKNE